MSFRGSPRPHAVPEGVLASPSGGWSPQGSCVTLGKLLNLSVPCFLHLQHEDDELPTTKGFDEE